MQDGALLLFGASARFRSLVILLRLARLSRTVVLRGVARVVSVFDPEFGFAVRVWSWQPLERAPLLPQS